MLSQMKTETRLAGFVGTGPVRTVQRLDKHLPPHRHRGICCRHVSCARSQTVSLSAQLPNWEHMTVTLTIRGTSTLEKLGSTGTLRLLARSHCAAHFLPDRGNYANPRAR